MMGVKVQKYVAWTDNDLAESLKLVYRWKVLTVFLSNAILCHLSDDFPIFMSISFMTITRSHGLTFGDFIGACSLSLSLFAL